MTCRGSRRNTKDKAVSIYEDSPEWLAQNQRSTRNLIRKWGHFVKHDALMKPIIPPKYNIGFRVENCDSSHLFWLEPWCSVIYCDTNEKSIEAYIKDEQPNTSFDLKKRVHSLTGEDKYDYDDIIVEIDGENFTQQDSQTLQQLPEIIKDNGEIGSFELGNLKITIMQMTEYQNDLIKIKCNKFGEVIA